MAVDRRTLREFVSRVGLEEVARRSGVSGATVKRWLQRGVSGKGSRAVEDSLRRSARSRKAAETRRLQAELANARGFTLPRAPEDHPLSPDGLDAHELTPRRLPTTERQDLRDRLRRLGRATVGESESHVWRRESYAVNENYIDVRDRGGIEAIAEHAIQRFRSAAREGYEWFHFYAQLIRFIPENPAYTGALARKAGKWAPDTINVGSTNVYRGTELAEPPGGVAGAIYHAFEYSSKTLGYAGSIEDVSHSRTIWFLFYTLEFFTRRPEPDWPRATAFEDEPLSPVEPGIFRGRRRRRRR